MANTLYTNRLAISRLSTDDTALTLDLLNDPDFINNVADRNVRNTAQARQYLLDGPIASYRDNGFGMYKVCERHSGQAIGLCGLVRRPNLAYVDICYGLLPAGRGQGYAMEAARRVLNHALEDIGLTHIAGIVSPDNIASIKILEALGMRYQRPIRLEPDEEDISLYLYCSAKGESRY